MTPEQRNARANAFALELLMPEEKFVEEWKACAFPKYRISRLAEYFGVEEEHVRIRAFNLGLG